MSSEKRIYLGGYIHIPNLTKPWVNLAHELDIVDEFCHANGANVLTSNYFNMANENEEFQVVSFNQNVTSIIELAFKNKHSQSIKKLSEYFKKDLTIDFGFVSYWW